MKKTKKIWFNGKMVNWDKAQTHVLSNGLHYGSGCFEGIRYYHTNEGPVIFHLKEHIDRLFYSASHLNMNLPYNENDIADAVQDIILKNMIKEGYVRIIFFWGVDSLSYQPELTCPLNAAIAVWPWDPTREKDTIKMKTTSYKKLHPQSTKIDAKLCGNYIQAILANAEILKQGFDEPLFLDYLDNVTEGAEKNIFFIKNGTLITPKEGNIMPGLTRDVILKLAADLGYKVVVKNFKLPELKQADEAFLTSTVVRIMPVSQIDDKKFTPKKGPVTSDLKSEFEKIVRNQNPKYSKYLTYVRI
ncbi:MAG: branched-chain amino acid transaminase [Patescibacteria group bacterium]